MSPRSKPLGSPRFWTVFLLILLGGIALAGGLWGYVVDRDLRARALTGEAEVVGYTRQVSARGGEYIGEPNALDLRYRDAAGVTRRAVMLRAGNEDLSIGSRFPVLYDPDAPDRIRRGDRAADYGFLWTMIGGGGAMVLAGLALIPGLRRRAAAQTQAGTSADLQPAEPADIGPLPDGGAPHRFYALAGRPVMETRTKDGGADLFAMDKDSGAFLPARELWPRLREGSLDLDEIDEALFRQIGREWRRRAMDARTAQTIVWEKTGRGEYPLRATIDGREALIRVNDFPDEPIYSIIIAGQSVGELEDWPPAWRETSALTRGN